MKLWCCVGGSITRLNNLALVLRGSKSNEGLTFVTLASESLCAGEFTLSTLLIDICYLPGGRSVWEKTVPEVLSTARGRRPRAVLKTKGTVFSHTDRPSPVNNIFIFFLQ